jgi:predicted dehydrogenase
MSQRTDATGAIGVGMIGYAFMGKAHSLAWHTVSRVFDVPLRPRLAAICGRDSAAAAAAAGRLGWAAVETDWRALIARDDVQLIDISAPGDLHAPIAIAALEAGKHVLCEKPLANTLAEAEAMKAAADAAYPSGARAMVGFNYRRVPALALARRLVEQGRLGTLRHFRAVYLQDWLADPDAPMTWRMQAERAGSGALGDLGAHIVDLARYLTNDEITGVSALSATFTTERPYSGGSGAGQVTVDDAAVFTARLASGALASFEVTRCATGRKNGLRLELNGSAGSLAFDLERINELEYFSVADDDPSGFRRVLVTEGSHPYLSAWWPPGHVLGWEHTFTHQAADLLTAIADGAQPLPSFGDGLAVQRVLDAVARSAASGNSWESITLWPGLLRFSPGSGRTCRLRKSAGWRARGATTGSRSPAGATTSRSTGRCTRTATWPAGTRCWTSTASSAGRSLPTWSARPCAITRSTSGTRASCPRGSGATVSPRGCGGAPRPRSRTRRGRRPPSACKPWSASPARRSGTPSPCSRRCRRR